MAGATPTSRPTRGCSRACAPRAATVATLCVNHRSVPAILREVERVVAPVMVRAPGLQPAFEPLAPSAARESAPGFAAGGRAPVEFWLPAECDERRGPARDARLRSRRARGARARARPARAARRPRRRVARRRRAVPQPRRLGRLPRRAARGGDSVRGRRRPHLLPAARDRRRGGLRVLRARPERSARAAHAVAVERRGRSGRGVAAALGGRVSRARPRGSAPTRARSPRSSRCSARWRRRSTAACRGSTA